MAANVTNTHLTINYYKKIWKHTKNAQKIADARHD